MTSHVIGHYEIVRSIGEGGMGVVHLARDTRLGRLVALKVLQEDSATDPDRQRRFEREARAASALNHPHIVTVYEIGEHQGRPFIAMEYVEGQTLAGRLAAGPMPLTEVLLYARQIAGALAAAHGAGIVHRDLKPANILLTPDRRAKVADFGLAKVLRSNAPSASGETATRPTVAVTELGSFMGTAAYVSPEQAEGRAVDARSDIFSFGCVLHEMVAGRRPFDGANTMAVLAQVIGKDPPPLSALVPAVPAELDRIVTRCLRKDPERRFQNANDLRVALDELSDEIAAGSRTSAQPARKRRSRLVVAASIAVVAVAAAAVWWFSQSSPHIGAGRRQLVSTFAGSHGSASFSPDGRMIAFISDADGSPQVWLKNLSGGEPLQITRGTEARSPRWSARNDQIVFERVGQGIWSVPPLGGEEPRKIADGSSPNLSADGRQMVFERRQEIWIAAADGTGARAIDGVPQRAFVQIRTEPALSPDGQTVAFYLQATGPFGDIWTIPVAGGTPRRVTSDDREAGSPAWTPDGRSILFWSKRTGAKNLWSVSAEGGEPEPITTGAGEDGDVSIAADNRMIFTNVQNDWIITITDPRDGSRRTLLERRTPMFLPKLSPDDQRIAFFGDADADVHLFVMPVAGGAPRQVTTGANQRNIHPFWSPDGRFLFYYRDSPEPSFRRMPASGGDSVEIATGWRWQTHIGAAVDPAGTRVAYHRQIPPPPESTMVRDIASGKESVISEPGPNHLHGLWWSLDGASILGTTHRGTIALCPSAGGPCREVRDIGKGNSAMWSRDRTRIYTRRPSPRPRFHEVGSFLTTGGDERKEAEIGPMHSLEGAFDLTLDGRILWIEYREGRQAMWIAEPGRR